MIANLPVREAAEVQEHYRRGGKTILVDAAHHTGKYREDGYSLL